MNHQKNERSGQRPREELSHRAREERIINQCWVLLRHQERWRLKTVHKSCFKWYLEPKARLQQIWNNSRLFPKKFQDEGKETGWRRRESGAVMLVSILTWWERRPHVTWQGVKDGTRLPGRRGEDPARKQSRCLWTPLSSPERAAEGWTQAPAHLGWGGRAKLDELTRLETFHSLRRSTYEYLLQTRQRAGENTELLQRERLQTQTYSPKQTTEMRLQTCKRHPTTLWVCTVLFKMFKSHRRARW